MRVGRPLLVPWRITDWKSAAEDMRKWAGSTLRRQLRAALAAARRENRSAGTGAHTQAEAVRLSALAVVRLVGPLAHGSLHDVRLVVVKSAH